jgi:serine/threonine-protein kinase
VRIVGDFIHLEGYGPPTSAPLGALAAQWDGFSPELRGRRATALARELVQKRRASLPPTARRGFNFKLPSFVAPLAILALTVVALWFARSWLIPGKSRSDGAPTTTVTSPVASVGADAYEAERRARAERVCQATRSRIQRGATVGPTDVEGWVVELVLLRDGNSGELTFDPGLSPFISRRPGQLRGKFVWASAEDIAGAEGPSTIVDIANASIPNPESPKHRGVRLTFSGRYVAPYFRDDGRKSYVRVAAALAERLGATHGALYARCAESSSHHLGAWFRGPSAGGAAASLVYWMGAFADPPQLRATLLAADGGSDPSQSGVLDQLGTAGAELTKARIAKLIGSDGGMIAGRPDGPHTLTFPFKDGNRAARASLALARELDVGVTR